MNLQIDDDLTALRADSSKRSMIPFNPDSLLFQALLEEPDNYDLHLALGHYYFEVFQHFGGKANYPESVLLGKMEMHLGLAYKQGHKNANSTLALGLKKLKDYQTRDAIPLLEEAVAFQPDLAIAYYNLAHAYALIGKRGKAIQRARLALEHYPEITLKVDAARLVADLYLQVENPAKALEFYRLADQMEPDNYQSLKMILHLERRLDTLGFLETRRRIYNLNPQKPRVYQDLYQWHGNWGALEELNDFLAEQIQADGEDTIARAYAHLFRAVIFKDLKNEESSAEEIKLAETGFQQVYPPSHEVFVFIRSFFKQEPKK